MEKSQENPRKKNGKLILWLKRTDMCPSSTVSLIQRMAKNRAMVRRLRKEVNELQLKLVELPDWKRSYRLKKCPCNSRGFSFFNKK